MLEVFEAAHCVDIIIIMGIEKGNTSGRRSFAAVEAGLSVDLIEVEPLLLLLFL